MPAWYDAGFGLVAAGAMLFGDRFVFNPNELEDIGPIARHLAPTVAIACGFGADDAAAAAQTVAASLVAGARLRTLINGRVSVRSAGRRDPLFATIAAVVHEGDAGTVLCLPFTAGAVAALHTAKGRRSLLVERTKLSELYLATAARLGRVRLASQAELVRAVRERRSVAVVAFPDHHRAAPSLCTAAPFLGAQHHVPMLVPVLAARGRDVVVPHRAGAARIAATPGAVRVELLDAVLPALEDACRARPDTVLSWSAIAERTLEAGERRAALEKKFVIGLLRACERAGGPKLLPCLQRSAA